MSSSEWKSIGSCPADEMVYLVDHKVGNEPYIGYASEHLFLTRKGREWSTPQRTPTHWAPIPMLKPPLVMEVGGYSISAGKQDEYILSLYRAGHGNTRRLVSFSSKDRDYLLSIGRWAKDNSYPWTKVAEAINCTSVASE